MPASLRPYPAYKDSGVPWLGAVPAHWEVRRQRAVVDLRVSTVDKHTVDGQVPVRLCNYVDVYKNKRITGDLQFLQATASADEVERFRLQTGDVIITKDSEMWTDIGVPALVQYEAPDLVCGYHLAILRPRAGVMIGDYLLRATQSRGVALQYHVSANGVTRYGLSHDAIKRVVLPVPPVSEQMVIARYLDHIDRGIRRYIRAKQGLVKLLEEKKQAIVHRAVTRGLDPGVRLRPSGAAWIGDVPAHWTIRKLRRCGSLVGGMTPSMANRSFWDGSIPWVSPKDMKCAQLADSELHLTDTALKSSQISVLPVGAVLLVVRGMILARRVPVSRSLVPLTINQDMKAIIPGPDIESTFLVLCLETAQDALKPMIDEAGHGTKRLPTERLIELDVPLPPRVEQQRIVEIVTRASVGIQNAIETARLQTGLLQEYRTRLIADVVTGRVDVRDTAGALPDESAGLPSPEDLAEADDLEYSTALDAGDEAPVEDSAGEDG